MLAFLAFSLLSAAAVAAPLSVVHEQRAEGDFEAFWRKSPIKDKRAIIPVRIGLLQSNLDEGYDHLMKVSHPESESYGKYWTQEEVEEMFAPSSDSIDNVLNWLAESGIHDAEQTDNKGWIAFDAPVGQVEQLLNTEFHEYQHSMEDVMRLGCDEYSLPEHIVPHIDYITPGVRLSAPVERLTKRIERRSEDDEPVAPRTLFKPARVPPATGPYPLPAAAQALPPDVRTCGRNITPPCLQYMYGIPKPNGVKVIANNSIGVFQFEQAYAQGDLNLYFGEYAPYVPKGTHPHNINLYGVKAPVPAAKAGAEADLDFMVVYGLLGNQSVTYYNVGVPEDYRGSDTNLLLPPLLDAVEASFCTRNEIKAGFHCGGYDLTQVVSVSYGIPEFFFAPAAAQVRICNEVMKLSLQGATFVVASGDYGVAANPGYSKDSLMLNGCTSRKLDDTYNGTIFNANFPASCPYVLSVGGTMLYPDQTARDTESAMNLPGVGLAAFNPTVSFSSGGGFANYFSRPNYQKAAVSSYLANHNPGYKTYTATGKDISTGKNGSGIGANGGLYNIAGRAVPDVSASGANFAAFYAKRSTLFDGTSVAAPIWSSILTLINHARANKGKGPVGFVNPTLYANPTAMTDIVNGTNPGCGTDGFPAVAGWDPNTGLGTPNYDALLKIWLNLP